MASAIGNGFIQLLSLALLSCAVHASQECPESSRALSQNCPPHSSNDQCKYHADCTESANHRCCKIGCQKICLNTAQIRASVLGSSVCPSLPRPSPCTNEPNQCIDQRECGDGRKCCSNGCRMICVEPVVIPTTKPPNKFEWKSCNSSVDVAFIVDSSGSISRTNYKKIQGFVKYVARSFGISPTESRAGIVLYSNSASVKAHFDQYLSTDEFLKAVDGLPHERGFTRIDKALKVASSQLFPRARKGVPKIAMVLTDGEQTKAADAIGLKEASEPLRRAGVRVVAFGVGKRINVKELRSIVERDEDVIRVMKFDDLITKVRNYSASLCSAAETEPIKPDADIIFLADSSARVTREQFESQKNFVRRMARYFIISPLGPRAAFVTYASTSHTVVGFSGYSSTADFSSKINSSPLLGGTRRIDQALVHAANMFRQTGRVGIRIVILLTAGNYYTGPGARSLSSAMMPLRSLGAYAYVVGIGPYFSPSMFRRMVSGPGDIFQVPSFGGLSSWEPRIARQLRLSTNGLRYEPASFRSDVVFLMDSSRYVGDYNYILEKNFVKLLARLLNLANNRTRAALYAYSDRPQLQITFDGYEDREAFESAVNTAPYLRGTRRIDRAFESAAELFRTKSRPSVPKYVILLTTGTQTPAFDMRQLDVATRGLRSYGARVFVVAILTGGYTTRDFYSAVQDPSDAFSVPSYVDLLPRVPSIASRIMATWRAPKAPNFAADVAFIVDSSSVTSPFQYTRAKRFVNILSDYLNISPGKSRGAMVTYGETPVVVFNFNSYSSSAEFKSKVNDAPFLGGEPSISGALHATGTLFSDAARGSYPWIAILLTAWRPTDIRDTRSLEAAARPLLNRGVWLYVLYIGEDPDVGWLRPMVVETRDAFSVVSYRDLPANIGPVASYITKDNYLYGPSTFQLDIVFLMDSSSNVGLKDFKIEKGFIQRLALHLGIFAQSSRAALVSYGDRPTIAFAFGGYNSNSEFVRLLNEAGSVGGERRIDRAFDTASALLLDARPTMPKAVILLTAGKQSSVQGSRSVESAAWPLHQLGAWVYVVAIGPEADLGELRKATTRPTDVFPMRSFADLYGNIAPVSRYVANTSAITGTSPLDADIVFVIDCSSSVPFIQYGAQKSFVRSLAQYLNIQPGKSRVALVVYGSRTMVVLRFDSSISRFDSVVRRAPYLGGGRRVDKALQATTGLFSDARRKIPKVVLLLMAGKQARVSGVVSLHDSLRPLHELGVRTFVFRIGSEPGIQDIQKALNKPGDAVSFSSYGDLEKRIQYVARHIPFHSALLAPLSFAADIVYLIDSSEDVTQENYVHEKDFVKYLARYLNMMPTRSRGAVVTYGSTSTVVSNFGDASRTQAFETRVNDAPKLGGQRRMDRAFDAAKNILTNARPAIPKVVILLTAGNQPSGVQAGVLNASVQRLQDLGARVYAVTINAPDVRLPLKSSSGSDWFPVLSYRDLPILVTPLARHVMSDTAAIGPSDFDADVVFMIDSSSGITPADYRNEKNFVKLLKRYLNIAPGKSRAAVMFYGSTAAVVLPFDGYSTISGFNSAVDRASQLSGSRRTDRAFSAAAKLFESARPTARKIAILLTGGKQSRGGGSLEDAVEPLRELGVTTYVIAIDSQSDVPVERPEDAFSVPSYAALPQHVEPIAKEITKKREDPETQYKADIVFVVDASNDSASSYNIEKDLVKSLARYFNVNPEGSRAALIVFNGRPSVISDFDDFSSASKFADTVDRAPYLGGFRRISEALNAAAGIFPQSSLSASKIVFLVTPGNPMQQRDSRSVGGVLQKLRAIGVRTYVALIGRAPDVDAFERAVEDPGAVFSFKSREEIPQQINYVGKQVTTDSATPQKLNLTMYVMFVVDSSAGVTPANFQREKEFVKSLIRSMNLYPTNSGSQVGIIVYSDGASVVLNLDNRETKSSIERIVDNLPHLRGARRIDKALKTAAVALSEIDTDQLKFVVLLTAGGQTAGRDTESFGAAVRALHDAGTSTHVLGIGDEVDPRDFQGGDKERTDFVTVPSFLELPRYVDPISRNLIEDYVARVGEPDELQFCPFHSTPRGCPDLVSNECITDEDCSFASSLCCSDGCRNICFDTSPTTPRTKETTTARKKTATPRQTTKKPTTQKSTTITEKRTTTKRTEKPTTTEKTTITQKATTTKRTTTTEKPATAEKTTTTRKPTTTKKTTATIIRTEIITERRTVKNIATPRPATSKKHTIDQKSTDKATPVTAKTTAEPVIRTPSPQVKVALSSPSDIVFLIDTSRDVTQAGLTEQKAFVKRMAKYFGVAPSNSHAAVITYSDTTRLIAGFYHYIRGERFDDVVDSVRLTGGRRRIDQALNRAQDVLTEARPTVPKIILVLSYGRQAPEFGFPRLRDASQRLRNAGATVYLMGVDVDESDAQLRPVVERPGDFFGIPSSGDLTSYVPVVAYYIASRTDGIVPKNFKADVTYLLDSSLYVGAESFGDEKNFTKTLARVLNHGPTQTRSSVIIYDSVRVTFDNQTRIGPFSEAVERIPYLGSTSALYLPLGLAATNLPFPRPGVAKVLVVLTNRDPSSRVYVDYLAARLREQGLFVNVLGIGDESDFPNLRLLTVAPGDFFTPKTFDDLIRHVPAVADNIVARSSLYVQTPKSTTTPSPITTLFPTTKRKPATTQSTTKATTKAATTTVKTTASPRTTKAATTKELFTTKDPFTTERRTTTDYKTAGPSTLTRTSRPIERTPTPKKAGYCPQQRFNPTCQSSRSTCLYDRDCLEDKKCCFDGCRFSCFTPSDKPYVPTPEQGKPGVCPVKFTIPCPGWHSCEHESQCPGEQKCCLHTCGFAVCSAVRKRDKPGSCPYIRRPSSCSARPNECNYDDECSGDLKCCSNGCRSVCISLSYTPPPIDFLPGKCPPYTPRMNCPSLVQDECTCDSDCDADTDYKCCYDGCRRMCRKKAGKTCAAKVDIIYLMDSSGSISDIDFQKQKDFVKDLVRIFNIAPEASHAGAVIYSDFPTVQAEFGQYDSSEDFAKAIDDIEHTRGRTRIDRALNKASEMFESARKNVNKILIVLTDGRQTGDPDAIALDKASQPLRDQGVRTYAIGVGHEIDIDELKSIVANNSDDAFTVDSFQDLVRKSQTIAEKACQEVGSLCVQGVDIAFLMDSSESITGEDFEREKRAVKVIAESIVKASKDSRAGVIMYSGQPELSVGFSRQSSFEKFTSAVDALPHRRSMTRIDLALRFASTSLFANPRPSVTSIAVVMTDGVQTPGAGVESLGQAVQPLRLKGVRVLAVGVGPRVDVKELNAMAASSGDVFQMSSFQELLDKAAQLLQAVCPSPTGSTTTKTTAAATTARTTKATTTKSRTTPTPLVTTPSTTRPRPICSELLDIVFVVDSSRSIDSDYVREKEFVKELATIFNVGAGSRAAVIVYSDDPQLRIRFNQYSNLVDFNSAVDSLPYLQRRTRIDKALALANRVLKQARPGFPRAVIVMTDGIQTRDKDAVSLDVAANPIHAQGARVFVVGIGPKIDRKELLLIARYDRSIFTVQSFRNLIKAARDVAISACSNTTDAPTPAPTTPVSTTVSTEEPAGFCPVFPVPDRCVETIGTCFSDRDCQGNMKCCFDNCRFICTRPDIPGRTTRTPVVPGLCPPIFDPLDSFCSSLTSECFADRQCPSELRCCFDGCRYKCVLPTGVPSPGPLTLPPTTRAPGPKCADAFDLGFAMDSSGSIRDESYLREKEFIKGLASRLVIGPQDVQLGLLVFSDVPLVSVRFGTLQSTNRPSFNRAVDNLPYLRGRTRIDSALYTAANYLFPTGRQDRVPQVLFLMTDGRQSDDPGATDLVQAVTPLREQGIKVIVIGIGADIDEDELNSIVESPTDDVFLVSSFRDLEQLLDNDKLTESLCISARKRRLQKDQS